VVIHLSYVSQNILRIPRNENYFFYFSKSLRTKKYTQNSVEAKREKINKISILQPLLIIRRQMGNIRIIPAGVIIHQVNVTVVSLPFISQIRLADRANFRAGLAERLVALVVQFYAAGIRDGHSRTELIGQ
jgi:hypothetical protein